MKKGWSSIQVFTALKTYFFYFEFAKWLINKKVRKKNFLVLFFRLPETLKVKRKPENSHNRDNSHYLEC